MTVSGGEPAVGDEVSPDGVRVLVVDDDERWARVTGRLLEANDEAFTVETAHSLAAGRERFREGAYDCVVCDYQLGDGTGLDLLEDVRADDGSLPFLLVTGRGDETVASDAIGGGVTDYIRKDADNDDATLLARRVGSAVETYRAERALERERRSKNAMLEMLTATTAQSELYRQFCSQLVAARGYACVWIGTADGSGAVVPRAVAGRETYLEAVTGDDGLVGAGEPGVRALERDEPVVVSATEAGANGGATPPSDREEWLQAASECGLESGVAVPVRHDGVRFGVLAAYADAPGAVDDRERAALVEYTETVGYALRTAERRRSLMSSAPVTVRVEVRDLSAPMVALATALPDEAVLDVRSAVAREDGTTLYVADATGASPATLEAAGSRVGAVQSLDCAEGDAPSVRCRVVASERSPEGILADHGARFERTVVERGVATVTVRVPDDERVTTVAESLDAAYDDATVSTVWTGEDETTIEDTDPLAGLTDRQREVLRHAYEVGYFERPRGASATDLAEHFDVARTTLSQHLRAAQRKVFGSLLS